MSHNLVWIHNQIFLECDRMVLDTDEVEAAERAGFTPERKKVRAMINLTTGVVEDFSEHDDGVVVLMSGEREYILCLTLDQFATALNTAQLEHESLFVDTDVVVDRKSEYIDSPS